MIDRELRAMGARFDAEVLARTRALFEPLWRDGGAVRVDAAVYGGDERQVADIYRPEGASALPVLVFVPGGGFTGGSRAGYAAFARHLASRGMVVVVADYRLAPRWTWPAGAEDVRRAVEWSGENAARFGGDARSLVVFGHSAGATHVAGAVFDGRTKPANLADVKGVILGSGVYRVTPDETRENVLAYFGADRSLFEDRSPLTHVHAPDPKVLVFAAELDPQVFRDAAAELAQALAGPAGPASPFPTIAGHNHVSTVFAVGTSHDALGDMIRRHVSRAVSKPR